MSTIRELLAVIFEEEIKHQQTLQQLQTALARIKELESEVQQYRFQPSK